MDSKQMAKSARKRKYVEENDDVLNDILTKKCYKRTKVYAGNKRDINPEDRTLKESCIQLMKNNLNALKCTYGASFAVLEPILRLASPKQLYGIENRNPYLIKETQNLWEYHVKKHFRKECQGRGHMWRDVYINCEAERKNRLEVLSMIMEEKLINTRRGVAPAPFAGWLSRTNDRSEEDERASTSKATEITTKYAPIRRSNNNNY